MSDEQAVQSELVAKFPFLQDKIRVARVRRIWAELLVENFAAVFEASLAMGFTYLATITGLDEGENFGAIYHMARPTGMMLNLHVSVPKSNPVLQSICRRFPAAECYERELVDLFGMKVEGLPQGPRYPLPDGWPDGQYPLRKDWRPEMLNTAAPKEGDKPNA